LVGYAASEDRSSKDAELETLNRTPKRRVFGYLDVLDSARHSLGACFRKTFGVLKLGDARCNIPAKAGTDGETTAKSSTSQFVWEQLSGLRV
jgi:hypothetical protein